MKHLLIHLKLVIVVTIWGVSWPAGRVLAQEIAPFTASWIRYVMAVAFFLVYLRTSDKWMVPTRGEWKRIAWIGFFSTCLYQAFFMVGMKYTAAGDASLMITFNPFFTALLAIVFLKEAMHWRLGVGLALGISGVAVLFFYANCWCCFGLGMQQHPDEESHDRARSGFRTLSFSIAIDSMVFCCRSFHAHPNGGGGNLGWWYS
jgi:drug/metabolite transporter (DMT)-like permease